MKKTKSLFSVKLVIKIKKASLVSKHYIFKKERKSEKERKREKIDKERKRERERAEREREREQKERKAMFEVVMPMCYKNL